MRFSKGFFKYLIKRFIIISLIVILGNAFFGIWVAKNNLNNKIAVGNRLLNENTRIFKDQLNLLISDIFLVKDDIEHDILFYGQSTKWNVVLPEKTLTHLTNKLISFASRRSVYHQIMILNPQGREVIRINNRNNKITNLSSKELQDKSLRYYFIKGLQLKANEIYLSPIDLNIEHHTLEWPLIPIIRAETPIEDKKNNIIGLLVLNLRARNLLQAIPQSNYSAIGHFIMIDETGHFLIGIKPEHEWGNSLPDRKEITLKSLFPELWNAIFAQQKTEGFSSSGYYLTRQFPHSIQFHSGINDLQVTFIFLIPWRSLLPEHVFLYYFALLLSLILAFIIAWFSTFATIRNFEHEEALEKLASTDMLTKIENRRQIYNDLTQEIARAKRYLSPFSILMLDLDHFKKINDTYGHIIGDFALSEFAKLCSSKLRINDHFGRIGGEEFYILLPNTQIKEATELAERFRLLVEKHLFTQNSISFKMTVSIGVTAWTGDLDNIEHIIQRVDKLLYSAKQNGRNQIAQG